MRIGMGYDVHRLVDGRRLILGGVDIPFEKGLLGHSDADALTHAICDALLGAAALGDIGQHFPDTDTKYKGIDSIELLKHCLRLVRAEGYILVNLDATVMAQAPKLSPYKERMRQTLAAALECNITQISVKATTTERLGYIGAGEGIAAMCIVLIE
ncbi:2-C-methyl-D-erythritol 2,4-cyclodiphosphate synthase [Desulfatitalea tepidiphila]|uniref:2-C-methyl-D-erythritol 2,4-cyclodiphosphate synthase n=1 Tax=Desulfatitalea tepidiphila TaxID=1185843 RepID=UPI0006B66003|nr:2-C-methyl-D-erythritol 2,4-cyclodiphosphate synthase [Desulfatitalea tepidiphila]